MAERSLFIALLAGAKGQRERAAALFFTLPFFKAALRFPPNGGGGQRERRLPIFQKIGKTKKARNRLPAPRFLKGFGYFAECVFFFCTTVMPARTPPLTNNSAIHSAGLLLSPVFGKASGSVFPPDEPLTAEAPALLSSEVVLPFAPVPELSDAVPELVPELVSDSLAAAATVKVVCAVPSAV